MFWDLGFQLSKVPVESFRHDIGQFHSPWMKPCKSSDYFISRFQLGKSFIKNIFIVKNLTVSSNGGNRCGSAPGSGENTSEYSGLYQTTDFKFGLKF